MNTETNKETALSPVMRTFVVLAACGQILAVLAKLFIRLLADPSDRESVLQIDLVVNIFNLAAILLLVLGLWGLARATKSRLWLTCFFLFVLRALFGIVQLLAHLGIRPESQGARLAWFATMAVCIVAAWSLLGLTLILRRSDGEAGLGMTTGIAVLASICLWIIHFMAVLGILSFDSFVIWATETATSISMAEALLLSAYLFGIGAPTGRPAEAVRGRLFFYTGAIGSVLIVTGLILIWFKSVGGYAFSDAIMYTFVVMAGLGLLGAGLGYLGQTLACRSPHGLVAAVAAWLQLMFFAVAMIKPSMALVWIVALLALAAQVAGGISFILSRKLAAPAVAVATGVVLLACALVSLFLLAFLGETGIDLPWRVRQVLIAIVQTGMIAAFTLATVHHLNVARSPLRL